MAYRYDPYRESEQVTQAGQALQQHQAQRPQAYQSQYQSQLQGLQSQISDRQPFQYNVNADALYQQYKDLYTTQGKQAMQNTMGQAAGLTGGYGSSYSQAAGQQQYNAYLQNLNSIVPELQNSAYNRYNQETQDLYNRYNMLYNQEAQDYGRWQDQMSLYNTELGRLQSAYDTERGLDYGRWQDQTQMDYTIYQAQQAQAKEEVDWYLQYGIQPPQELIDASGYSQPYIDAYWDYWYGENGGGGSNAWNDWLMQYGAQSAAESQWAQARAAASGGGAGNGAAAGSGSGGGSGAKSASDMIGSIVSQVPAGQVNGLIKQMVDSGDITTAQAAIIKKQYGLDKLG